MGDHSKQHIKIKDDIKELQAQNRQLRNELAQKLSPLIDNPVREWKCHAGGINCSSGETPLVKDRANHSYSNMYLNNSYYQIIQLSSYRLKHYCILLNLHHSAIKLWGKGWGRSRVSLCSGKDFGGNSAEEWRAGRCARATASINTSKKLYNVGQGGGKA